MQQSVLITLLALSVLLGVDKAENRIKALRRGVHKTFQKRAAPSRAKSIDKNKNDKQN